MGLKGQAAVQLPVTFLPELADGNDLILGGADIDVISGGAGKDRLVGGAEEPTSSRSRTATIVIGSSISLKVRTRSIFGISHRRPSTKC